MQLIHGDCLELYKNIEPNSIDLILTDLPYGITQNKWDSIIPFDKLWEMVNYLLKPNGAFVTTASQPFTSALVMSNPKMFKYEWIWSKISTTGHLNAKKMPLKSHENILVFYQKQPTYNPQKTDRTEKEIRRGWKDKSYSFIGKKNNNTGNYGDFATNVSDDYEFDKKHPNTIITCSNGNGWSKIGNHPTQKPVALYEYLLKTYSNEKMTIFDPCMGSGTTGVACKNLNRNFIGIEKDDKYFEIAKKRIEEHLTTLGEQITR